MIGLLLACSPASVPGAIDDLVVPEDEGLEQVGEGPDLSEDLFGTDRVFSVEIDMSADAAASLGQQPFEYVPVDIRIDEDEWLEDVGIRIKGRIGSYRTLSGKSAFRVDLDRFVEGQRWRGLKGLTLNNMVNDYAQIHEIIAYDFYRHIGIAAPRVGYAWVTINDADYGLYAHIETPDDRFLARSYPGEDQGNYYEADYAWYPDGSYDLVDFTPTQYHLFELDEGDDVGLADILEIVEQVQAAAGTEDYDETVEAVDWPHFHRFWNTEIWLGQWDGYNYNSNNYRLYFHPEDGKAELLPWGHDWIFHDWRAWSSPRGTLSAWCLHDTSCAQDFKDALIEVADLADAYPFEERIDEAVALVSPYIAADPRKETSVDNAAYYQDVMRDWVTWRSNTVLAAWGLADPEVRVGSVYAGEVELFDSPDDLDLSDAQAWNFGGETTTVGGVDFVATYSPGSTYASNVPTFDDAGLATVAYSCQYHNPGTDLELSLSSSSGESVTLQLLFFEPYYSLQGYRIADLYVEGELVVEGLDTHAVTNAAGVLYRLEVTPEDDAIDVRITNNASGDGYTIISGAVISR